MVDQGRDVVTVGLTQLLVEEFVDAVTKGLYSIQGVWIVWVGEDKADSLTEYW